jgi:plasmid stabilization system protein ParE
MILLAPEALDDLERIFDFLAEQNEALAIEDLSRIREAMLILEHHPVIGRLARPSGTLRELVISRGRGSYVGLYEYSPAEDLVRVVATRHQREVGYRSL